MLNLEPIYLLPQVHKANLSSLDLSESTHIILNYDIPMEAMET